MRKKGKLPANIIGCDYELEYGKDRIEIYADAILERERVILVDDLIATGGIAEAGVKLIRSCGGVIVECAFVVDLPELGGKNRLKMMGVFQLSLLLNLKEVNKDSIVIAGKKMKIPLVGMQSLRYFKVM